MSNQSLMDWATAEHFYSWLGREFAEDEQHDVEQAVHAALRDEPDMVERGKTWWQIMDHGYALQGR